MFGGLELKGSGGGGGKKDGDNNNASSSGGGLSGFGFLNGTPATTSSPAPAPALSSFSFLNPTTSSVPSEAAAPAPATTTNAPEPAAADMSGFSFLQQDVTAPAESEANLATTKATNDAMSSFDFLIPTPENKTEDGIPNGLMDDITPPQTSTFASTATATATTAGSSGSAFSFLSGAGPTEMEDVTTSTTVATTTTMTGNFMEPSSALTSSQPPAMMAEPSSAMPVGAGMTFAPIGVAKQTKKKKKTRALQVGVNSASMPTSTTSAPSVPVSSGGTGPDMTSSQDPPTREAAADAARRAEEFMRQKEQENLRKKSQEYNTRTAATTSATNKDSIPTYGEAQTDRLSSGTLKPTASTDEEVAAAVAAAEEAMELQAKSIATSSGKRFMGGFFKGFGSGSNNGGSKGSGSGSPPTVRTTPPLASTTSAASEMNSTVDPLAKQQEMKRAMAERQYQMQQEQQQEAKQQQQQQLPPPSAFGESGKLQAPLKLNLMAKNKAPHQNEFQNHPSISTRPEKRLEEYQQAFARSVQLGMDRVTSIYTQRRALEEERVTTLAKKTLATQQIAQAELQLEQAAEQEDYELADQLGQVMHSHQREQEQLTARLNSITKSLETLDAQTVVRGVAECFHTLARQLKELHDEEQSQEVKDDSEALKSFSTVSKQLSAENDRLQHDLKHIEREEQFVAEERKELETAISEKSGQYEVQRDSAKKQLTTVEEEIEELRKQLTAKQAVAADLRTEIYGLEDSISKVRLTFSRQLSRVEKKERAIEENRHEWESEKAGYDREKEAHEFQVQTHSEALLAHHELMRCLESEMALANQFSTLVTAKWGSFDEGVAEKEDETTSDSMDSKLRAKVTECEALVSKGQVMLKTVCDALMHLEAECKSLDTKIPELESMKKEAAAKRDFKAASKANKDLKEAMSRKSECDEELALAAKRKEIAQEECRHLEADLAEAQQKAHEQESVAARVKMEKLANQLKHVRATKKKMCTDTKANAAKADPKKVTSAAGNVQTVGGMVLEGQIQVLRMQGEALGAKYGGWEELMDENTTTESEQGGDEVVDTGDESKLSEPSETNVEPEERQVSTSNSSESKLERITKVRKLIQRIKEAEEELEAAAEREEFDKAAELHEVFQTLQTEMEEINLTDEESELAFAEEFDPSVLKNSDDNPDTTQETNNVVSEGETDGSAEQEAITNAADAPASDEPEPPEEEEPTESEPKEEPAVEEAESSQEIAEEADSKEEVAKEEDTAETTDTLPLTESNGEQSKEELPLPEEKKVTENGEIVAD